jgi:DNA-binding transcriptional LysR family regulator
MNLHHLRYFRTLAYLEHYTKAADELKITQPSLSYAINSLEEELSTCLFEKEGRNIRLTKYGKLFLKYVEDSLDNLDTGIKKTKAMTSGKSGFIDLAYIYSLGSYFIPEIVSDFLTCNADKDIKFSFSAQNTTDIVKGLKEEKYDVAFCSKKKSEADLEFTPIMDQKLVLIVPHDHELANKDKIDLKEVASFPFITYSKESGLRSVIDNLFTKVKIKPNIVYELIEDGALAGLVAKNFGIAIVPELLILENMNIKKIEIVNPKYKREIYLARVKNKYLPPVVHEFIKHVINSDVDKNYL